MAEKQEGQPGTLAGLAFVVALLFVLDAALVGGRGKDFIFSLFPEDSEKAEAIATTNGGEGSAILAEAQKLDGEKYVWGGGHPPTKFSKGSGVDCSGLVNVAVKNATGISEDYPARGFRNSKHWSPIAAKDASAGDIMYQLKENHGKTVDHVVIVVKNGGDGKLTIFEASTSKAPAAKQVRERAGVSYGEFDGALRFKK